ncbi:39S ribosomal protein L34, mitochondrial [Leptidea sinapis]|uniref:39S ribosomal protein L34, mitochondrial n=1 Tax=Leptidea sinapis TaxID=189913 RepID=UPI0021C3F66B|nr:39S ribosomal protein L34, mitochondrial [Leptidea sinapis]
MSSLIFSVFNQLRQSVGTAKIGMQTCSSLVKPDSCILSSVRTKVRCYFPRPNEVKRIRRHGWEHRISTPNGRRIIMRRLLKGRFVLSH